MELTTNTLQEYLDAIKEPRKTDILLILNLFKRLTNMEPHMWGTIIGFGNLHYKYESGREGNMPLIAFSNRKQAITLYLSYTISDYPELEKLGKHKTSKSCLYINKLDDINIDILEEIVKKAIIEARSLDFITEVH